MLFDPDYVVMVDDDPEAVREGVAELCARDLPPEYVRARTFGTFAPHREAFIAMIPGIYDREGVRKSFKEEFARVYTNRMLESHSWADIRARLHGHAASASS